MTLKTFDPVLKDVYGKKGVVSQMPAKSQAMQVVAAIALHHPEKLHAKNRSILSMSKEDLRHYAETKRKGLPKHTKKSKLRNRIKSSMA